MSTINWMEEVLKRKDELVKDTQEFLRIKSVLDEENGTSEAPLGEGIDAALQYLLLKGSKDGFLAKNVDGLAGHVEMGEGEELVGILCHVDVVPEGDGWSSDPFGAEIREGKIFARGAIDDKGPTMAAYYAMKIVKDLGIPLNKRIRMIIGTDEESNWRCVDHYFKHEEMPTMGFAPDADFPIIYAEKGIADFDLVMKVNHNSVESSHEQTIILKSFQSGRRYNMVPDFAEARLNTTIHDDKLLAEFNNYITQTQLLGKGYVAGDTLVFELEGQSAHGMEPKKGKNAGLLLASFLKGIQLDKDAFSYITFLLDYFYDDSRGEKLGVRYSDEITGDLTINVGKMAYTNEAGGSIGINLRYPVTNDMEKTREKIEEVAGLSSFALRNFSDSKPHHVDKNHTLIKTLQKVYEEQTGEEATLISIGGGTYARSLKAGVAFGPLFPGRPDSAHQKDEYIIIEDLLKATAIYAQAISELGKI
ncbi:dipeptidase PepV [Bacillus luteolus]|uniref:Dipeptidase PepV n=1 Tax=Litchfieldia luteola TaxID=682179 RepID=A0ABR9QIK7_9BACI|nr:dipeptidase PepV [Cytobacillus luteolus]MBE4908328.1 dipeptidase PepV [Cytobacillus luteolus]MBP1943116.1 succinyl-diaminopimelate desuccinylase [Cytobacillus luteolus]